MGLSKAHGKRTAALAAASCLVAGVVVNVAGAASPAMSASLGQARTVSAVQGMALGGNGGSQWGSGTLTATELHALVAQMTLGEEGGMVHGEGDPPNSAAANANCAASAVGCVGEAGWIPGVARLGIPPLRMTDGPAGVRLRPRGDGDARSGRPGRDVRHRPRRGSYGRRVGAAGRATDQDVWLGPMINEVNYPTGGPQLRDARRGPVPGRPAGRAGGAGRPERGHDRRAEALHRERLRERPHLDQRHHRRPDAARDRTAGVRGRHRGRRRLGDVLLQPDQRHLRLRQPDHACRPSCASSSRSPGSCSPTGARCTGPPTCSTAPTSSSPASGRNQPLRRCAGGRGDRTAPPRSPATADFPAYPAISAAQWKSALDTAVFHILSTMNQAGLLEGTQYGSHFTGTPPP